MQQGPLNSLFEEILKANGIPQENLGPKVSFIRDNKPPEKTLLITSRFFGPKRPPNSDEFPFDPTNTDVTCALTANEANDWTLDRISKLIDLYEQQKQLLPLMADANKTAIFNAKASDRRKYFYYCHLLAISNAPRKIAFSNIESLNCLRKLWRNKAFSYDTDTLEQPDHCCEYQSCPFIAIHGTKYCMWHILNDPNQQMFEECPVCKNPKLICDAAPCPGHKPTQKERKKVDPTIQPL